MDKRLENLDGYRTIHLRAGAKDGTLREKRLALEMTQQEVADKAKISLSSYQKFEIGDRNIRTASFELVCRVLKALEMDPTAFYEGEYVFGEPTIFDKEGRKYIRSGRLIDEEINEQGAAHAMCIHFIEGAMVIPLKALRALNSPEYLELLYQDNRLGIRVVKKKDEYALTIPKTVYSGRWRGVRICRQPFTEMVYELMGGKKGNYSGDLSFFEKGCVMALDEVFPSEYMINEEQFFLVDNPEE